MADCVSSEPVEKPDPSRFSAQHGARAFDQIAGKAIGEASGNRFVANFLHHNQG
jgi:hypothetical protein